MPQSQAKHVHKLRRHKYKSGNIIYFCTLPDCNYKVSPALAVGKRSLCNICGNDFILTDYAVRLAKPHCEECHKPKGGTQDKYATSDNVIVAFDLPIALDTLSMDEIIEDQVTEGTKYTSSSLAERLAKASHKLEEDEEDEDEI